MSREVASVGMSGTRQSTIRIPRSHPGHLQGVLLVGICWTCAALYFMGVFTHLGYGRVACIRLLAGCSTVVLQSVIGVYMLLYAIGVGSRPTARLYSASHFWITVTIVIGFLIPSTFWDV
jgi:hypothetical protein